MEENKKRKNTKKQRQKEGKGKFEQCYACIACRPERVFFNRPSSLLGVTKVGHRGKYYRKRSF